MTTPTDNDLFNEISKAMQDDDSTKLSSLLAQETPEEEEQPEEELPADEPEGDSTQDEQDEPSEEDGEEQEVATEEVDPLAALRAELAELKKNQQSLSSQAGRVPSLQRKLAEYDRQLADLKKNATSGTTSDKVKPKLDEALKDLEDTDPALAAAIRNAVGGALSEVDTGSAAREISRIESLREAEYAEYVEAQKEVLLNKYPNVSEVFASDSWKTWKKEQPKHVLELAGADSAEAVIMALDIYKRDMLARHPELAVQKTEKPVVDERASQIEESRKKQQQRAANLDSGKPPARSKGPSDPEALFKQFSEEIRKDIRGA
jgi:hypothetical protein